jgi:hypothetical protein
MTVRLSASRISRPPLPRNTFISVSGKHFCLKLSKPQGVEGLEELGEPIEFIRNRTRDCPTCSIMLLNHRMQITRTMFVALTCADNHVVLACTCRPGPGAPAGEEPQQAAECRRQCGAGDSHQCGAPRWGRPPGSCRLLCERRQTPAFLREQYP